MKRALLVALREYAENAKTKGFWIGLLLFPVMLIVGVRVPTLLEKKATPTRHFALVDRSGQFEPAIDAALARHRQRRIMQALFNEYLTANMKPELRGERRREIDLERIPAAASDPQTLIERFSEENPQAVEAFISEGGRAAALKQIEPYLREDAPPFVEPREAFRRVELPEGMGADADLEALAESIKPMLRGERSLQGENGPIQLFAAILIPADLESRIVRPGGLALPSLGAGRGGGIEFWSSNLADSELRGVIESAVNEEVRRREYARRGLDAEAVRAVQRSHAPFVSLDPTKAAGEEEVSLADVMRQFVPIAFVYLLWIAIFTISQMLLSNTIEEKSNRIIEVLLSSVTAGELMMGKLLGIAAIGLTMIGAWLGSMIAILLWFAGPEIDWAPQVLQILLNSKLLPAFALYFVLGYLMYAGIFLAIGGVCNTLKEAQNLMGPVMLIMMVPLITMFFIPKDPHGGLARALSWIPLYTPFVMMNRAAADPPAFDLIGTFILMAASTVVVLWLTGRIFRIGILRTGQPPKLMELFRWLKG